MEEKSNIGWIIVAIIAIVAIVGLVLLFKGGGLTGNAASSGTDGKVTDATDLAKGCIVDLYGDAAQFPKVETKEVSVDDAISKCVKERGRQTIKGGKCDPNLLDGCSATFSSAGQDPDSDPQIAIFDVFDRSTKVITDTFFVTEGGQILGVGTNPDIMPCMKSAFAGCPLLEGCERGRCMAEYAISNCAGFSVLRRGCPNSPDSPVPGG